MVFHVVLKKAEDDWVVVECPVPEVRPRGRVYKLAQKRE